jgi:hypothetical protein
VWWIALHALVAFAFVSLGAPVLVKSLALLVLVVHAIALPPERALGVVLGRDGRVAVPELGLTDLTLGPRTLFTENWVRFDLRGSDRPLNIVLLSGQVDPLSWHALQARLRSFREEGGNARGPK